MTEMTDDERKVVEAAFEAITDAIDSIESRDDIDAALETVFQSVEKIAPGFPELVHGLTTEEIGNVLARFAMRVDQATDGEAGNTPEQSFLAMVVLGEIHRRARLDGIAALEWARRERIRGFMHN